MPLGPHRPGKWERKRKHYKYSKLKRQKAVQNGKENQKDPSYPEGMGLLISDSYWFCCKWPLVVSFCPLGRKYYCEHRCWRLLFWPFSQKESCCLTPQSTCHGLLTVGYEYTVSTKRGVCNLPLAGQSLGLASVKETSSNIKCIFKHHLAEKSLQMSAYPAT